MGLFDAIFGGSEQRSFSSSSNQQATFTDPRQQPYLDLVRNLGSTVAVNQLGTIGPVAFGLGGGLLNQGGGFLGQLQQAGQNLPGITNTIPGAMLENLSRLAVPQGVREGLGNLSQRNLRPNTGGLEYYSQLGPVGGTIRSLESDLGRFLGQQVLPQIRGEANLRGQLGGSRQGVAEGLAAQGVTDAYQRGLFDIYESALDRGAQTSAQLGQLSLAGQQATAQSQLAALLGQGGLDQQQQQLRRQAAEAYLGQGRSNALGQGVLASQGLGALNPLFNLGMSPYAAQLSPLLALSNIIGRPTVLGQSSSTSSSSGSGSSTPGVIGGLGNLLSFNFGF